MEHGLVFESHRRRLFAIAYRIVKNADDAEDLVQETAVRWLHADVTSVRTPGAWLVTTIRRLAIDSLRRATTERRVSTEAWLREPLAEPNSPVTDAEEHPRGVAEALRTLIERLGPDERIAFVLREVFGAEYGEVGRVLAKSEVASRQIVHRARGRLHESRPTSAVSPDAVEDLIGRCLRALALGEREPLLAALARGGDAARSITSPLSARSREPGGRHDESNSPEGFAVPVESDGGMVAAEVGLRPRMTGALLRTAATVPA